MLTRDLLIRLKEMVAFGVCLFLNSLNIPSRLYEVRAKFSVANETYFLYVAMQTRLNFVRNLADMGN